jgi:hypothetical protein
MRLRSLKISSEGQSLIELAMVLPLLLLLGLGVFEFSRALYVENTIANMSREGANLFSRTLTDPHDIINTLISTAPSSMGMGNTNSIVYITKVSGLANGNIEIIEQHRPIAPGAYQPASRVPTNTAGTGPCPLTACSPWVNGTCIPVANSRPLACLKNLNLPITALAVGRNAFVVEVFYKEDTIFKNMGINIKPDMYSITIF